MNLSKQIKKYREQLQLSQEELAEKIYVSRQTISNWENERSYPDVHNLLLLSVLFDVSLDELVKGDVEQMKERISSSEMNKYTKVMVVFLLLAMGSLGPAIFVWGSAGLFLSLAFWAVGIWAALKIEKIKKTEDVQTYREIVAFMEDKNVALEREKRNPKRDFWHKALIVTVFVFIAGLIALLSCAIFLF